MTSAQVIEVMLLRWGDTHTGRTVTFQLPADGEHPFRDLPCGPANGQRMALSVALIAEDETQEDLPATGETQDDLPDAEDVRGILKPDALAQAAADPYHYSRQAAMRCDDRQFQRFLGTHHGIDMRGVDISPDIAATIVRGICQVQSRAEFDSDPEAAKRWRGLMTEFDEWRGRV